MYGRRATHRSPETVEVRVRLSLRDGTGRRLWWRLLILFLVVRCSVDEFAVSVGIGVEVRVASVVVVGVVGGRSDGESIFRVRDVHIAALSTVAGGEGICEVGKVHAVVKVEGKG